MTTTARKVLSRWLQATAKVVWVRGGERKDYMNDIWEMYRSSYAKIGLHVSSASGLLEYDSWELFVDDEGKSIAFNLYKSTPFGLKTGLVGSDGSSEAKGLIKSHIKARFSRSGVYGEVSHAVERLAEGSPVVCAVNVPTVLNKTIVPTDDGVHYQRSLQGIGMVTKKMVGSPRGVPSGSESMCPLPETPGQPLTPEQAAKTAEQSHLSAELEAAEHASCQLFGDDD